MEGSSSHKRSMNKDLAYYCKKFKELNVNRNQQRGIAPHKPILLLSVLELFEQRKITQNKIYLTAQLISTFLKYWSHLGSDLHQPSINLPFYHLKGDKFWHLQSKIGLDSVAQSLKSPSLKALQEIISYAYLDSELFILIQDSKSRSELTNTLVSIWFLDKKQEINQLFNIDAFKDFQDRLKDTGGKVYSVEELDQDEKVIVRDAAFRKVVVSVYNYQCAFCRLRIVNSQGQNIVDGSHIKPFSEFRDDRINNGLSLCKNHHWAFDRGWFGINEDYRIKVTTDLEEITPNNRAIKDFEDQEILFPNQTQYKPRLEAFQWHFENVFQKSNSSESLLFY